MDISKLAEDALHCFHRRSAEQPDRVIDNWIREAVREEAAVPVPPGAWDRLRKAISDRRMSHGRRGMWLLDEPFRDPPESPPATLSDEQLRRAMRLYNGVRRENYMGYQIREMIWTNLVPTFSAVVNL